MKKNIIHDNIIFSMQTSGGISYYWAEIQKRLIREIENSLLIYEGHNNNIFVGYAHEIKKLNLFTGRLFAHIPFFLRKIPSPSLFHSSYYRISLQKDVYNITTVHDFIHEYYPYAFPFYEREIEKWHKRTAILKSYGVICVSENTKRDLLRFYPKASDKEIEVIYHAAHEGYKPLHKPKDDLSQSFPEISNKTYILYVGSRAPYKNFPVALSITKNLPSLSLVVVGGGGFSAEEKRLLQDIQDRVYNYQGLSIEKLNILYNNALCLVYPSFYEGFGIPPLEAMQAGCPVVVSYSSSLPEVVGEAGILCNPENEGEFVEGVRALLNNPGLRLSMKEKGFAQAQKFSWEKTFQKTLAFYERVWRKIQNDHT
ncbi:glycosyl transferase, group 1 family protein [Brevinematales bacterium NS]|nr:glycosyl transferase, group 1 family protein [Brevinematales bacterium NS]